MTAGSHDRGRASGVSFRRRRGGTDSIRSLIELIWVAAVTQARIQRSAFFIFLGVVQPAVFLIVTMLAADSLGGVEFAHAAVGVALLAIWSSTIWQAGLVLRQETWFGTLSGIVVRPARLSTVLIGKTLGTTVQAAGCIALTVVAISFGTGHAIEVADPGAFAGAVLALLVSAATLGLLLSCLFLLTRSAIRIAEALIYPGFILGGLLIPIALLPAGVRPLANLVSLYWGGRLVRDALDGESQDPIEWLLLGATTAGYAILAVVLFERVMRRARRVGSLELV